MASDKDGYVIPLHRSLTERIMLGGAPRNVAIINGTIAAAIGLGLQLWIAGAAIWLAGHGVAVLAAKRDPQFMDVLMRHIRHKPFLGV
ncbi:MAG: conjugal transfer protein TrbD [Rhizobiaceae bacterium]|nr:conjugal transfer protein TrbD [Rhizobiaceae bacterium]